MPVWSLGWEDPLEEEMATHSSILAWRIPWREEAGGLLSIGSQKSDTTDGLECTQATLNILDGIFFNFYFYFILLYNTVLVLPYIDMNPPTGVCEFPILNPPPTSHPISSL